jgi:hypothetical protein
MIGCRCCDWSFEGLGAYARTRHGFCYECATRKRTERHHVWGKGNSSVTIEIPGNWHRVLDGLRAERCELLKKPGADPLHRVAAAVTTIGEGAIAFAEFAERNSWPAWIADIAIAFANATKSGANWLLCLAGILADKHGPDWAEVVGMPAWKPT